MQTKAVPASGNGGDDQPQLQLPHLSLCKGRATDGVYVAIIVGVTVSVVPSVTSSSTDDKALALMCGSDLRNTLNRRNLAGLSMAPSARKSHPACKR